MISPGSAGHGYVFAELAYRIHDRRFTALVMPKQGGRTITELLDRHDAAPRAIATARHASGRARVRISGHLDLREMVDAVEPTHAVEARLLESYLGDLDCDRRQPLAAILSLLDTPPPRPVATLSVPTMFIVPSRGFAPDYARGLFARLPPIDKELVEVDGSAFWMVSHSAAAADLICGRLQRTLAAAAA